MAFVSLLKPLAKSRSVANAPIEAILFHCACTSWCSVCGVCCSVCVVCAACGVVRVAWRDRHTEAFGMWCDVCVVGVWSAEVSVCVV